MKALCQEILVNKKPLQPLVYLQKIENPELKQEIRIEQSVILRIYNANPAVFINQKLNKFITDVAKELYAVS